MSNNLPEQLLSTSDIIQVIGIIVSLVIAVVGFIFTAISIRQTSQAQRDMARPYINFYIDRVSVKNHQTFYVIKNFGTSPAYITDIKILDGELDSLNAKRGFKSLVGNMLAPSQKLTSAFDSKEDTHAILQITYKDIHQNQYVEKFTLNTKMTKDLFYAVPETSTSDEESSAIRQSTMALLRELR